MARKIDEKKTRKALSRLKRARRAAEEAGTPDTELSEWEGEFLGSLEERLETFGSAFSDPEKGSAEEALSVRQAYKLREIEKKAKGKARKPMSRGQGFRKKTPQRTSRSRDIHDDLEPETPSQADQAPRARPAETPETLRARFRIVPDPDEDPDS